MKGQEAELRDADCVSEQRAARHSADLALPTSSPLVHLSCVLLWRLRPIM